MNNTRISKAQVSFRFDPTKRGVFTATVDAENNQSRPIHYVSPYASNSEGAFIAVPEVGVEILVCQPEGSDSWYYLGSTFTQPANTDPGKNRSVAKETAIERVLDIYENSGFPMRQAFLSKKNAGLVMHEEYSKTMQNIKTVLKSSTRKKISLIDTPALDSIIIDSGNNSRITLTDTPQSGLFGPPAQAILIDSNGPQKLTCQEANIDIAVNDGKDINITNGSTGFNAAPGDTGFGNINLQSDTGDINLFTTKGAGLPNGLNGAPRNTDGRIFLQCLNPQGVSQVIQLETRGTGGNCVIRLISSGKIELQSVQDIDIISGGNINMTAAGSINTLAGVSTNLQAGTSVNADAATVNLNSGTSTPPIIIPTVPPVATSYYPVVGIPTYTNGITPI